MLVSRCPSCYPPGAYDALKARRTVVSEQSATRTTARVGANLPPRGHKRTSVELGPHTERAGRAERTNRAVVFNPVDPSGKANVDEVVTGDVVKIDAQRDLALIRPHSLPEAPTVGDRSTGY